MKKRENEARGTNKVFLELLLSLTKKLHNFKKTHTQAPPPGLFCLAALDLHALRKLACRREGKREDRQSRKRRRRRRNKRQKRRFFLSHLKPTFLGKKKLHNNNNNNNNNNTQTQTLAEEACDPMERNCQVPMHVWEGPCGACAGTGSARSGSAVRAARGRGRARSSFSTTYSTCVACSGVGYVRYTTARLGPPRGLNGRRRRRRREEASPAPLGPLTLARPEADEDADDYIYSDSESDDEENNGNGGFSASYSDEDEGEGS